MKLIEKTPSLLIYRVYEITDRVLFGVVFIVSGLALILLLDIKNILVVLGGGLFVALGFFTLLSPVKTCIFDKTKNKFTFKRQSLFGKKIVEYNLREIQDIEFNQDYGDEVRLFQVSIVLLSNKHIHLTSRSSSARDSKQRMASCIKTFLEL